MRDRHTWGKSTRPSWRRACARFASVTGSRRGWRITGPRSGLRNRASCSTSLFRAGGLGGFFGDDGLDEIDLRLVIRHTVGAEDVVEPDGRLTVADVRLLPRVPRQERLRLAGNEAPIDGRH